jgi:16S rRNA (guanine966-N2)-methyltransferase
MRIIAGSQRGRKLISVSKKSGVKPISDRMKQSLFDILRPNITGSVFLDLFAGTGSVGLEALSRQALKTVFVDIDSMCIKTIKRNIEKFNFKDRSYVVKTDILKGLNRLYGYTDGEGYDIIFIGVPYRTKKNKMLKFTGKVLSLISVSQLTAQKSIIIAQHHKKEEFDIPKEFELYRSEKYGDTIIDFFRKKGN